MRRVFVSGYGMITAFGNTWESVRARFESGKNATRYMSEWDKYGDLITRLACPIDDYETPPYSRKQMRSMGRVGIFSVDAASRALDMAGLLGDENIKDGRMGVASGSSTGSTDAVASMARLVLDGQSDCNANTYIKMMPHTTAANIALFFGLKGRIIPTSSACTSASHAIGYAYESIKFGRIDMMIAGGAEELCVSEAYVFDTLYATSTNNKSPHLVPRPFCAKRDGLVLGEGAGYLILESEESLQSRGGVALAEVIGFGSTSDGTHITQPNANSMKVAMELAIRDSGIDKGEIGYINAHATATTLGDIAESCATEMVFGERSENLAISSTKSFIGHTLGACGGLEAIFSIEMMRDERFFGTLNVDEIDCRCANLRYLRSPANIYTNAVMSNNFAFGGVNTSLIFKRV